MVVMKKEMGDLCPLQDLYTLQLIEVHNPWDLNCETMSRIMSDNLMGRYLNELYLSNWVDF